MPPKIAALTLGATTAAWLGAGLPAWIDTVRLTRVTAILLAGIGIRLIIGTVAGEALHPGAEPGGWWRTPAGFVAGLASARLAARSVMVRPRLASVVKASANSAAIPVCGAYLSPIEMLLAKPRTLLRQAKEEATRHGVSDLLGAFSSEECAACLRHAGHASTAA